MSLYNFFNFLFVFLVSVTCFRLNNQHYIPLKVKLVGISNYDIVDGKSTPILGLIWSIILRFQVRKGCCTVCVFAYSNSGLCIPSFLHTGGWMQFWIHLKP